MICCTTFGDWAWELYAKEFLETYVQYWQYPIHVYVDTVPDFRHPLITYHGDFSNHTELKEFHSVCTNDHTDYRKDAGRFAYKVFAQYEAIKLDAQLIWLDADIVTFAAPDHLWLEETCAKYPITLLAREKGHSETGFVMFNAAFPVMVCVMNLYRMMYTKKLLFQLPSWTDCHALDYVRRGLNVCNLSPQGQSIDHVWPDTKLAEWCYHRKGIEKFSALQPSIANLR